MALNPPRTPVGGFVLHAAYIASEGTYAPRGVRVAFTRADFQPQMAFDPTGETGQHALRGGLAADVDVALIGVAGKTQAAFLPVFIQ